MNYLVGFFKHLVQSALHKDKRDWEIIFYSTGTACLFWFLHSMGKEYQHPVKVPVEYIFSSESVLPVASLPQNISVQVSGTGWNLAKTMFDWDNKSLKIQIRRPLETDWLLPQNWKNKVKDLLQDVQVEGVLEDTIFCRFDRIERKQVGLYADLQHIQLKPGFQISSPVVISPTFVEFTGASSIIRKLPNMIPVKVDARNINQSFDQNVALQIADEYPKNGLLQYQQDVVNVRFTVRPSLEEEWQLPITLVNGQNYPGLVLMERKVAVTFLISEADKSRVQPEDFDIVADMETFNPADSTVLVSIRKKPMYVSDVQLGTSKTRVYAP